MSDFKELVPEFYDTDRCGDFLTNKYAIDFGTRHDGRKVGDVELPQWANSKSKKRLYILIIIKLFYMSIRSCRLHF